MKIKICGLMDPGNIKSVSALQPDMMGFIFYPLSKRYAGREHLESVLTSIPQTIDKVAVFANAAIQQVLQTASDLGFDTIQLHGSESSEYCRIIRANGYRVIKAVSVKEKLPQHLLISYTDSIDALLFDTATPGYGGSGQCFDWNLLAGYHLNTPCIISGGIGIESLPALQSHPTIMELLHKQILMGVDANSQLEDTPGIKNIERTKTFINQIRNGKI